MRLGPVTAVRLVFARVEQRHIERQRHGDGVVGRARERLVLRHALRHELDLAHVRRAQLVLVQCIPLGGGRGVIQGRRVLVIVVCAFCQPCIAFVDQVKILRPVFDLLILELILDRASLNSQKIEISALGFCRVVQLETKPVLLSCDHSLAGLNCQHQCAILLPIALSAEQEFHIIALITGTL